MSQILIIEDSGYQRLRLRKTLRAAGYETIEAENGRQGVEMIEAHRPACALLDLVMPEIDGVTVLEILAEKQLNIPIIVHTSDIQETTRDHCLALGAVAVLNKPLKQEKLLDAINQALKT
jgi:CheY-like chemotaxis protein